MYVRSLACATAVALLAAAACAKNPVATRDHSFTAGQRYFDQKKYAEAIVEYRKAIQADPRFGEARYRLGEAYEKTGDLLKAYSEFARAADLMPDNIEAQLKTGLALLLGGQYEDARTRAQKVIDRDARNVRGQIIRAQASAGLKDYAVATSDLQQAIAAIPDDASLQLTLGEILFAANRKEEAEQAFRAAVAVAPNSGEAHLQLGKYLWSTGRTADAEQELVRAVTHEPKNALAQQNLAMLYLQLKRPAEAESHLQAAVDPGKPDTMMALADYYLSVNRADDARRLMVQAAAHSSSAGLAAKVRLAELDFNAGRRPEARQAIDDVLARDKTDARAMSVKARFLLEDDRPDDALKEARNAVAANPRSFEGQLILGRVLAARNDVDEAVAAYNQATTLNPRSAAALMALAQLKLQQRALDEAGKLARQALREQPDSVNARVVLVQALIAAGNFSAAEQEIKPFAAITTVPDILVQRGFIALGRSDAARAAAFFDQALKLKPDSVEALSGLVAVKLATKKAPEAEAAIDAQLAKHPDDPKLLLLAAKAYLALGKNPRAEQALRRVLDKDAKSMDAYAMLGMIYAQDGKLDRALTQYEEMAKTQPSSVAAHTMVGTLLITQNRGQDARRSYTRALEIDPNAAVAANNLAWLEAEAGENLDVALNHAQVAKRQLPDHPGVNDTLGWIYYKKGLVSLAIPLFEQSVAKDSSDPTYYYHLGLAQSDAGNPAQARQAYEHALAIRGDFPGADVARKALGRSGPTK